ncbi:MAG: AAA family ATPase [Deltaproteobacteria bacterium]|nr:AAA family ATPase [Deltaproteobacteria bacterium]
MDVKGYISNWRYYHLSPAIMKQAYAAVAQQYLAENGDNFSAWFMTLQTGYPEEFRLIKQAAKDSLPGLEEILTPPTQFATTYLITKEQNLERPVTIWHMSDGEILFLAWLSLIFAPAPFEAPVFCVEELENHLHPRLLEILVEVVNQRQKELGPEAAQIIVTTHSPYLVDKVNFDDLIVFEKSNGATKSTRPSSKAHLKELLERKELGLGELWYSGALGG